MPLKSLYPFKGDFFASMQHVCRGRIPRTCVTPGLSSKSSTGTLGWIQSPNCTLTSQCSYAFLMATYATRADGCTIIHLDVHVVFSLSVSCDLWLRSLMSRWFFAANHRSLHCRAGSGASTQLHGSCCLGFRSSCCV